MLITRSSSARFLDSVALSAALAAVMAVTTSAAGAPAASRNSTRWVSGARSRVSTVSASGRVSAVVIRLTRAWFSATGRRAASVAPVMAVTIAAVTTGTLASSALTAAVSDTAAAGAAAAGTLSITFRGRFVPGGQALLAGGVERGVGGRQPGAQVVHPRAVLPDPGIGAVLDLVEQRLDGCVPRLAAGRG